MRLLSLLSVPFLISFASAATYTVGVGKDETTGKKGVGFDPSAILPQTSDVIVFEFRSGSHSVVESTFDKPCTPKSGGFNTGVVTVPDSTDVDADGLPTVNVVVNSTDPIWFFDQASGECNQGAVLSVNPTGTQTAAQFKENSLTATEESGSESTTQDTSSTSSVAESSTGTVSSTSSAPSSTGNAAAAAVAKDVIQASSTFAVIFSILLGLM